MKHPNRRTPEQEDAIFFQLIEQLMEYEGSLLLEENDYLRTHDETAPSPETDRRIFGLIARKTTAVPLRRTMRYLVLAAVIATLLFTVSYAQPEAAPDTMQAQWHDSFTSVDGTVEFRIDIDREYTLVPCTMVEVSPHYFTGEDVKRITGALLGDVSVYEDLNDETDTPCRWTFYPPQHYDGVPDFPGYDPSAPQSKVLRAHTEANGIPYSLSASIRDDDEDFLHSRFAAYIMSPRSANSSSDHPTDLELMTGPAPTDQQIEAVKSHTAMVLKAMDIGQWYLESAAVHKVWDKEAYYIKVTALPRFGDMKVPYTSGISRGIRDYDSNFKDTTAEFLFNTEGTLISCEITSPLDIIRVIAEDTAPQPFSALIAEAKIHFAGTSARDYFPHLKNVHAKVTIDGMGYGVVRANVPGRHDRFYYVPAVSFWGTHELYHEDGSPLLDYSQMGGPQIYRVLSTFDKQPLAVSAN